MPRSNQTTCLYRSKLTLFIQVWLGACLCLSCFVGVQAQTVTEQTFKGTPHDEVQKSMSRRDWSGAMATVDEYLKDQPRDPQMRFWKGMLLDRQGQRDTALQIYRDLVQEYPELPEPHNNLGVILAAKGDVEGAKAAFEMAIRTNPSYAIAHENLGDVYAKLASQSYDKALQLDSNNATAKLKLTMVRNLVGSFVQIGRGKQDPEWMKQLLQAKDRQLAAPTFMPDGLYLTKIAYPPEFDIPSPWLNASWLPHQVTDF